MMKFPYEWKTYSVPIVIKATPSWKAFLKSYQRRLKKEEKKLLEFLRTPLWEK